MRNLASISITISLLLAGCSSGMDSAECVTADWRAIGYEDGAQGRGSGSFGKRRKDCAAHGIAPDFQAYMDGRDEGLARYCTPRNGYRLGAQGYGYNGVCPPELEPAFETAHADGFGLYQRRSAVARIGQSLRNSKRRADEIELKLVEKTAQLVSASLAISTRAAIGVEIKQLAEEKAELKRAIPRLEQDYAGAQQDYESYRQSIANRHGG